MVSHIAYSSGRYLFCVGVSPEVGQIRDGATVRTRINTTKTWCGSVQ